MSKKHVADTRRKDLRRKNEEFSRRLERGERQISIWLDRDSQARLERLRERCGTNASAIAEALRVADIKPAGSDQTAD